MRQSMAMRRFVPAERQLRIGTGDERHVVLDTSARHAEIDEDDLCRSQTGNQRLCQMDALDAARAR